MHDERPTSARRRGPRPPDVALSAAVRAALERLARAHTTAQLVALRARVVLAAADGLNNTQIGAALGVTAKMARQWRRRWLAHAAVPLEDLGLAARLADAPRPGAPPTFTAEQWCQVLALACEPPGASQRPTSHWTPRELADEAIKRQIVPRISARSVGRFLDSWRGPRSSPTRPAPG
jgi:putative transposase